MRQKRYHVYLPLTPYKGQYDEIRKWLKETYGNCWQDGQLIHSVSNYGNRGGVSRFTFTREKDAVLFSLKWL